MLLKRAHGMFRRLRNASVSIASKIMVAREDLSIPGADEGSLQQVASCSAQARFFDLLRESKPDVVVLNLTVTEGRGVETIRSVRERSCVPILVVCASEDTRRLDYCAAGAAECLHPPVDITVLDRSIRNVIHLRHAGIPVRALGREAYRFNGMTHRPQEHSLCGTNGLLLKLTTAENEVLRYLLAHSWSICSRAEIADFSYSDHSPAKRRAVGVIVSQLRRKLDSAGGNGAGQLIKTELRRGYTLVVDVETLQEGS
jgi:two-component system, OmpR family, response regulator